jgi:hypothetical protein
VPARQQGRRERVPPSGLRSLSGAATSKDAAHAGLDKGTGPRHAVAPGRPWRPLSEQVPPPPATKLGGGLWGNASLQTQLRDLNDAARALG